MKPIQIHPGERILLSCRTHWKNFIPAFTAAASCAVFIVARLNLSETPIFFDVPALVPGVKQVTVSLFECVLAALLMFSSASSGLRHLFVRYVITTDRLIHHSGFIATETTEIMLCYSSNLFLTQSVTGRILDYGDFRLRSGGVELFFNDVPNPWRFKSVLVEAMGRSRCRGRLEEPSLDEEIDCRP